MPSIKYKDSTTGNMTAVSVKVGDTLPVGTEIDYDGNSVPLGWEQVPDGDLIVSASEPSGNDRRKVWLQHSKNLFDKNVITDTSFTVKYQSIEVKPNTDYTLSTDGGSSSSALLFLTTDTSSTTTTNNGAWLNNPRTINSGNNTTMYVGYRGDLSSYWIQLETGSTATTYEPYGDKICILDEDNIYREYNDNKETILYVTSTGSTTGDINLSDDITNYKYLEIFYKDNNSRYSSVKVETAINRTVDISLLYSENNAMYIKQKGITLRQNKIEQSSYLTGVISSSGSASTNTGNTISIMKVIGYK